MFWTSVVPNESLTPVPSCSASSWQISVDAETILPVVASHNTIRLSFTVEAAEYLRLHKASPSIPVHHFSMLADSTRNEVPVRALLPSSQKGQASPLIS